MSLTRPENQIILLAVRRHLDAAAEEQLRRLLREDLDWLYLLTAANRQGVVPLLQKNLANREVPPAVTTELQEWKQEIFTFNLFLCGELVKLLDLFEQNGIEAIPFKGPAVTLQAHGDVGSRQYKDLDILVHKNDVDRVSHLLRDRGFQPTQHLTPSQEAAQLRFGCATTFTDARGVIVDVHWQVAERHLGIQLATDDFWSRLESVEIGGRTLLTLSAEDVLLVLCCHGYAHSWDRLGWICDVGMLVESRRDLDWAKLLDRARRSGLLRIVLLGLVLAGELLQIELPAEANRELEQNNSIRAIADEIIGKLFLFTEYVAGLSVTEHLRMRERKRDKLRTLFALFLMPREYDWMFVSTPAALYYAVRPFRWTARKLTTRD
jgi:hypothetical protein